jgi:hypothetical protein
MTTQDVERLLGDSEAALARWHLLAAALLPLLVAALALLEHLR